MSEILKRLQKAMKEKTEVSSKKEPPQETKPKAKKAKKKEIKIPKSDVKRVTIKKSNVQYNKSQLLKLLNTVNLTDLTPKQKRALKALGTSEPIDKSDRKIVTLWDQKKTTLASLELILSIFMQQPIKIRLSD